MITFAPSTFEVVAFNRSPWPPHGNDGWHAQTWITEMPKHSDYACLFCKSEGHLSCWPKPLLCFAPPWPVAWISLENNSWYVGIHISRASWPLLDPFRSATGTVASFTKRLLVPCLAKFGLISTYQCKLWPIKNRQVWDCEGCLDSHKPSYLRYK